ncbi:cupin domain-containing protein [Kiritimatiellaeota bacterium B1221]|nr:cupin domain-containing protein [Kiritimatiellaeota bacterium B1221]
MNYLAENLSPHPEGGHFREVYRSSQSVVNAKGSPKSALTHIYFSLASGEVSRFHRVEQEEVWNLYRGDLRLWILNPDTLGIHSLELSAAQNQFCAVIPPGHWQAAEVIRQEVLIGCTVAPGFDFSDFELIHADHPLCATIRGAGLTHLL